LGSIGKVENKLGETVKETKFTPPSPIKATPNRIARDHSDVYPKPVNDAGDVTIMSLELYINSVILVGIGQYFLGIYCTNTKGKLGWYI
jgi:hypothetical protein